MDGQSLSEELGPQKNLSLESSFLEFLLDILYFFSSVCSEISSWNPLDMHKFRSSRQSAFQRESFSRSESYWPETAQRVATTNKKCLDGRVMIPNARSLVQVLNGRNKEV
jgi:hypothetical protein